MATPAVKPKPGVLQSKAIGKLHCSCCHTQRVCEGKHIRPEAPAPMIAKLPTGLIWPWQLIWNLHMHFSI